MRNYSFTSSAIATLVLAKTLLKDHYKGQKDREGYDMDIVIDSIIDPVIDDLKEELDNAINKGGDK